MEKKMETTGVIGAIEGSYKDSKVYSRDLGFRVEVIEAKTTTRNKDDKV